MFDWSSMGWEVRRHPRDGFVAVLRDRDGAIRVVRSRWRIGIVVKSVGEIVRVVWRREP